MTDEKFANTRAIAVALLDFMQTATVVDDSDAFLISHEADRLFDLGAWKIDTSNVDLDAVSEAIMARRTPHLDIRLELDGLLVGVGALTAALLDAATESAVARDRSEILGRAREVLNEG